MAQPNTGTQRVVPPDDLYTTLLITASALLLLGIIFISVRSVTLFGSLWPAGGG